MKVSTWIPAKVPGYVYELLKNENEKKKINSILFHHL